MQSKALAFSALILIFSFLPVAKGSVASSPFILLVGEDGSIGFQTTTGRFISLTVTDGTLNSSNTLLSMSYDRGTLTFNSSSNFILTLAFSNSSLSVATEIAGGRWNTRDSGYEFNLLANQRARVKWWAKIYDPFVDFTMPAIGLGGIILVCFSAFWTSRQLRSFKDETTVMAMGWGLLGVVIGLGLILVWLW